MFKRIIFSLSLLVELTLFAIGNGPIVLIVGTRPEAIKVIPVYQVLKSAGLPAVLCSTGQHKELLDDIWEIFNIKPDFDFKIMKHSQDLFYITEEVMRKSRDVFEKIKPSLVIVQGDTTTAISAALSAFYLQIPVGHIEAGLRTGNIYAPFPEELNRTIISRIAVLNFAPTEFAASKLRNEGIKEDTIYVTGNTVVDALYFIRDMISLRLINPSPAIVDLIQNIRRDQGEIMLLTAHRRESFQKSLKKIFTAIKYSLMQHPSLHVIYPMHPNPIIRKIFNEVFIEPNERIIILQPLPYQELVYLLDRVDGVATDSGGIQEEAISLNKMTLVLRNETDRPEGVFTGIATLVGDDEDKIISGIEQIFNIKSSQMQGSPYGDGNASQKIKEVIQTFYEGL